VGTAVRDLAAELAECRLLLVRARELERRRLVTALAGVTADRLTALRRHLAAAAMALSLGEDAGTALGHARADLDELLDRFRGIARGVYPAVLRDQGPFAALDELIAGLPRPVVLDGGVRARLAWEIESGLYHPAAAAVTELAGQPGGTPLRVRFAHADGRLSVRIDDPAPGRAAEQVAAGLRDEAERLAALGGDLTVAAQPGMITVAAWVPERLGPDLAGVPEADLAAARAHAEAIASARREAVAEMDSERRAVERDLHDGAQHHLVALRLALGMVEFEVGRGLVDTARDRLAVLADQVAEAELVLAETAAGLSPAALTEGGLAAALAAECDGAGRGVEVVGQARRFPPEVESAVYFCCLEAVGNARRHAPQAAVRVEVGVAGGVLRFSVHDDGPGFVPRTGSGGRGLANMVARMAGVGGTVVVESVPGVGTTVAGTVPLMPA
jgi:signal transduction histidine kinase